VVLSVDPMARRMAFSLKQAAAAMPRETSPAPAAPEKKKKRPPLRGGLDF
jgi:hypothetical protein